MKSLFLMWTMKQEICNICYKKKKVQSFLCMYEQTTEGNLENYKPVFILNHISEHIIVLVYPYKNMTGTSFKINLLWIQLGDALSLVTDSR